MQFLPGQEATLLNKDFKPVQLVTVMSYNVNSARYKISYRYENTNESEIIEVPLSRLAPAIFQQQYFKK